MAIIRALPEDSSAAIQAYGKTSQEFSVTRGVRQGCVLAPTLVNLDLDAVISLALGDQQEKGVRIAYLHGGKLVGNRRKLD